MKIIFEQSSYKINVQNTPDLKVIDLLKRTLWGTKETTYQHQQTEQNSTRVPDPLFFSLEKDEELIGTCCFSKRSIKKDGRTIDFWYSRYFSIDLKKQGSIFGNMILRNIRAYFENEVQTPSFFYAYVDASNVRSHKLLSHIGFEKIRNFETLTFSRLYPKKDKRVAQLLQEEQYTMLNLLQEAYKEYTCVHFDAQFFERNYFVLKVENEIVAGIRANMAHWVIRSLSGLSGKMIIKIIPHIPILSRLFNPTDFRFMAFDGIYCKAGYEKYFFLLMESICASSNVSTGLTWLDTDSPLYFRLKDAGNWGIMDKLKEKIPAYVVAAFKHIPKEEQEEISTRPVYISAVDII